jgi:hypothetical protein
VEGSQVFLTVSVLLSGVQTWVLRWWRLTSLTPYGTLEDRTFTVGELHVSFELTLLTYLLLDNAMTPPPTNQTKFRQWSTGAIFYSNIFLAEALGKSGKAQVADLALNNDNDFTPGYASKLWV